MANWSLPSLTDLYTNFLTYLKGRDDDAVRMNDSRVSAATNVPDYAKRWNATTQTIQNWLSAAWSNVVMAVAGGGTGASTADGARTNLSVYSMAEVDAIVAAGHTYSQGENVAKMSLTIEATWYDCVSLTLAAGTWLIIGHANAVPGVNALASVYVQLWNGTSALASSYVRIAPTPTYDTQYCAMVHYIASLGSSTTMKLRACRTEGSSSTAINGSSLRAVKIV